MTIPAYTGSNGVKYASKSISCSDAAYSRCPADSCSRRVVHPHRPEAYFHVLIHPEHMKYLHSAFRGQIYPFSVLSLNCRICTLPLFKELQQRTSKVLANIKVLRKELVTPTATDHLHCLVSEFGENAGTLNCGAGGEDSTSAAVLLPWSIP